MTVPSAAVACWAFLAVLPFWSVYLAHAVLGPHRPTGFLIFDSAYYCANAREIFERGNGLAYCNPFDPDPAAPVIYWHWLPWLVGVGTKVLGVDPGFMFCLAGAIGGFACAFLTFRLVEAILPASRALVPCYLLVMWGGGLLVASAVAANLVHGRTPLYFLLQNDPFNGWWFLNWGRNLVLPTEAVYHALVAAAWLAAMQNRPWPAVGAVAALAATHPFSGIQHLLVLGAWLAWRAIARRRFEWPAMVHLAVMAAFLGYYFGYLPRFPQHVAIHSRWSLHWVLDLGPLVAAGAPVFALAAARCWRDRHAWRPEMTFFVIAACVSLALAKHELLMPARQPLHFTRGYTWLPLCLLGLPLVEQWLSRALATPIRPGRWALAAAFFACAILDNTAFILREWNQHPTRRSDCHVSAAMADAFAFLDQAGQTGTVLALNPESDTWTDYNYLSATYTSLTPLIGHPHLTPGFDDLAAAIKEWRRGGNAPLALDRVDVMIIPLGFARPLPGGSEAWRPLHANDEVVVLQRMRRS